MTPRYALYAAPPGDTPLGAFGTQWLGRDAESSGVVSAFDVRGFTKADIWNVTETPRRYGFHATLKPPFRLAPGRDLDGLMDAGRAND